MEILVAGLALAYVSIGVFVAVHIMTDADPARVKIGIAILCILLWAPGGAIEMTVHATQRVRRLCRGARS